jgi:predicted ATPase/class 3 adenylate cyclase
MGAIPTGTLTFLFTDIEGHTPLWEAHPEEMRVALERHDEILRSTIEGRGGYVFTTAGDSFAAAFGRADDAIEAAREAQLALAAEPWPRPTPIQVRMGVHTGEATERDADYFGPAVIRAARIMSAGHGGQVLVSGTTAGVVGPDGLTDLGEHRLKDLSAPEHLFQIGSDPAAPLRTLDVARHNLPVMRTPMLGRDDDLTHVLELLDGSSLVSLTGIGGTGKTRLAMAAAAGAVDAHPDGVWFVDLVPVADDADVPGVVAGAAGLELGLGDPLEQLISLMDGRRALFVLDNCEHVTEGVADLVDVILEGVEGPTFLVTSREPLGLPEERHVSLQPLAVHDDGGPAVELFLSTAERSGVSVPAPHRHLVAEVCRHLDGLPLAIELAAGQLRHLALAELVDRLDQRFELLGGGRGRRRRRQASLDAVLQGSWDLLDQDEQDLLRQLAAFPGDFTLDAAEVVVGGSITPALAGLVDRALVTPTADRSEYRLLETVKLFVRRSWDDTSDPDRYLARHAQWLLDTIEGWDDDTKYMTYGAAAWHERHLDDLRAADDFLRAQGRFLDAAQLWTTGVIAWHLGTSAMASAAITRINAALDRGELPAGVAARLELARAGAAMAARNPALLIESSQRAIDLASEAGDEPIVLSLALNAASWMQMLRDLPGALSRLEEAELLATRGGAPLCALAARGYAAFARILHGDLAAIDELEVIESVADIADTYVLNAIRSAHWIAGVLDRPLETAKRMDDLYNAGDGPRWTYSQWRSVAFGAAGLIAETDAALDEAELQLRQGGSDDGLPDLLLGPVALALALGEEQRASRWLTAVRVADKPTLNLLATAIYRQLRARVGLTDYAEALAETPGVYAEARRWLDGLLKAANSEPSDQRKTAR